MPGLTHQHRVTAPPGPPIKHRWTKATSLAPASVMSVTLILNIKCARNNPVPLVTRVQHSGHAFHNRITLAQNCITWLWLWLWHYRLPKSFFRKKSVFWPMIYFITSNLQQPPQKRANVRLRIFKCQPGKTLGIIDKTPNTNQFCPRPWHLTIIFTPQKCRLRINSPVRPQHKGIFLWENNITNNLSTLEN